MAVKDEDESRGKADKGGCGGYHKKFTIQQPDRIHTINLTHSAALMA